MEKSAIEKKAYKITVIDDSDYSRKSIISILDSDGFNVTADASNAKDALMAVQTTPANLYIVDVVMPDSSGIEIAKYITDQKNESSIIMISSLNTESIIMESITAGAMDFLQKPFSREDLLKSVYKAFNQFNTNREST